MVTSIRVCVFVRMCVCLCAHVCVCVSPSVWACTYTCACGVHASVFVCTCVGRGWMHAIYTITSTFWAVRPVIKGDNIYADTLTVRNIKLNLC